MSGILEDLVKDIHMLSTALVRGYDVMKDVNGVNRDGNTVATCDVLIEDG